MAILTQTLPVSLGGSGERIATGFAAFIERNLARIRLHIEYRRAVAELEACSDRVLADIGVNRDDIRSFVRDSVFHS